jgi:hypothetical protein
VYHLPGCAACNPLTHPVNVQHTLTLPLDFFFPTLAEPSPFKVILNFYTSLLSVRLVVMWEPNTLILSRERVNVSRSPLFHFSPAPCIIHNCRSPIVLLTTCFHADILLQLYCDDEDGGKIFLRNASHVPYDSKVKVKLCLFLTN